MQNNIYTLQYTHDLNAGTDDNFQFVIGQNQRTCKLKRVTFDYGIFQQPNGEPVPVLNTDELNVYLTIGSFSPTPPAKAFENIVVLAGATSVTGHQFTLRQPQSIPFDNFIFNNQMNCEAGFVNASLLNEYRFILTIIMEIEYIL